MSPISIYTIINQIDVADILIDTGYLCYILVNSCFAYKAEFKHFDIRLRPIEDIDKEMIFVHQIIRFQFDIHDHKETEYAYIFKDIFEQDLILNRR